MAFTKNVGGRPLVIPKYVRSLRDLMRRHLREEKKTVKAFSAFVGYATPNTMYDYFYRVKRPIPPAIVDALIDFLKLDEFDADEIRLCGAIESGWQLRSLLKDVI